MTKEQMNWDCHLLAVGSVIVMHFKPEVRDATIAAIALFAITTVLHLFKELDKLHVDAKNQTVDIEDDKDANNEKK